MKWLDQQADQGSVGEGCGFDTAHIHSHSYNFSCCYGKVVYGKISLGLQCDYLEVR